MITISHLSHRYTLPNEGWLTALNDISLSISEREYVAIIGPNGSGKTTLARCLNGLITPTSGNISIDTIHGIDPHELWEARRRVGMVFQNPDNQIVSATVEREIAFGLENLGLPSQLIQDRVEATLQKFDLSSYRYHAPHRLSGGEKQRLAIASVMAMEPRYLVLDEPTSLLDPVNSHDLIQLLKEIHSEGQTTIIHITQFPEEALQADRLIVIVDGQILKDGDPLSIFSQPGELRRWGLEAPIALQLDEALRTSGLTLSKDVLLNEKNIPSDERVYLTDIQNTEECKGSEFRLVAEHLSHVYDKGLPTEREALRNITVRIKRGECVAIIGPTGSGKTTLAEHFMGLLKPSTGKIFVDGLDLRQDKKKASQAHTKVGLVFQFPELQFFEENVRAEIAFGPRNIGLKVKEIEDSTHEALDTVGLDAQVFGSRAPLSLSAGEQRLVAIASILSMKPEILILDEPTAGLDPMGVQRIYTLIEKLKNAGTTILVISHHIELVSQVANRVIVLHEGRIVLDDSANNIFQQGSFLTSIGLDIPKLVKIMKALRKRGWDVKTDVFTLQEAKEEILTHQPASNSQGRIESSS